jgi:hypothetical protein
VLFLHGNGEDYLADSLLHGLRTVLGAACVDAPRRDALYDDLTDAGRAALYGHGFTLYGRLPEVDVDRQWPLERARRGEFDVVVVGDVHRNWGPWVWLRSHLRQLREHGTAVAVLDGGDGEVVYPYGPTWWKRMRPWPLPRAHGRVAMYKRELTPKGAWIRYGGVVPPPLADRLLRRHVRPIAFSIPEEHVADGAEERTRLLPTQVIDPELARLVGAVDRYAFDREADYHADLRASRFGVTMKKAGWDALRHYEVAASGAIPCVRDLHAKPPHCAPHGLRDGVNCIAYADARALLSRIEAMGAEEEARLRAGTLEWARANTTTARARAFLASLGPAA